MGRTRRSPLLLLGLLTAGAEAFYFCVPLSATGVRSRTFGSYSATSSASRRTLSVNPLALAKRRGTGPTMDAGEDFDQLDGKLPQMPRMPETIDLGPGLNASSATPKVDIRFGGVTFGRRGEILSDVHSILPTGGAFDLPAPPPPPAALPEYSLENENAASDHAASAAAEIARKIAESSRDAPDPDSSVGRAVGGGGGEGQQATPSSFRAAALKSVTEHVETRERRAGAGAGERAGQAKAPAGIDATRVPNLWLAVAHSSSVKVGEVKKVVVDGVPIALWRTAVGAVAAQSDVCIHRGASLARGWVSNDRLVCPYHGFEFESNGRLAHMPGAGPPTGSAAAAKAAAAPAAAKKGKACGGRKAPTYQVKEVAGWIYIFPDDTRPGSVEQHRDPVVIPEALSPEFRSVEGSMDFRGGVDASVENMLDMLHISFVHSFGNQQDPTPFEVSYERGFDDPGVEALATSRVTFRYRSGSKSFSKVVGKSNEVVVKNEFHLPYRAVIRVFFGNSLKTIEATAVPKSDGETTLHWKLYRNFAITHPRDEGPINKAGDFLFRQMMELTLKEDKDIIENIYPEYQKGFMNARYDQQMLQYRKAITSFQATAAERANTQLEASLQMELLNRISRSQRGLASTRNDRSAILDLIQRLEDVQATPTAPAAAAAATTDANGGNPRLSAAAEAAAEANARAATAAEAVAAEEALFAAEQESVEGEWHLEYVSNEDEGVQQGWDLASSTEPQKEKRIAALKEAGGEALLFDWKETGRPLWADTSESVQIIDTKARTLTNRAVYKGWSGFTTTVQLDAVIEPLKDQGNRLLVGFHKAIVNVGGMKVTFPHLQRFSPTGWMETTYLNQGIRIARGNKGSIFVLTRHPVSSPPPAGLSSPPSPPSPPSPTSSVAKQGKKLFDRVRGVPAKTGFYQ